jgi:hypothetical protein
MEWDARCPYLYPVLADQLCVYPIPAYCRRPSGGIRIPATATLMRLCMDNYAECSGYQACAAPDDGTAGGPARSTAASGAE